MDEATIVVMEISREIELPFPQVLDGVTVILPGVALVAKTKLLVGVVVVDVKLAPDPELVHVYAVAVGSAVMEYV